MPARYWEYWEYWEYCQPIIIISRTVPNLIHKLFEQEIPSIFSGLIFVKHVVRIPGEKSKVSVESLEDYDPHIEQVGSGIKGIRIHAIVKELKKENIDVIKYTKKTHIYILRALSTAKISMIEIDEQNKKAMISLKYEREAIGRKGKNICLAGQLTGYKINILRNNYLY